MEQSLSTAVLLLFVGMLTVFIVLLLVVFTGKMLIKLVNRISYDKLDAISVGKVLAMPSGTNRSKETFNRKKLAVLIATVDIITQGEGKISKIEKIN